MEVETAARRMLLADSTVDGYVTGKVFKFSLLEHPNGTSGRAVVVGRGGGWSRPDPVKTSEFPLLWIDCWADPDRDSTGNKVRDNAGDKAYAVYRVVDRLIHAARDVWWGTGGSDPGLRVITAQRWAEPRHINDPTKKINGIPVQDCAVVTVSYALQVAH